MSYTNIDRVRHHLVARYPVQERVRDQLFVVTFDQYQPFYGGAVEEESLVVKSVQAEQSTRTDLVLTSSPNPVGAAHLARGSVVVASDSSLGCIYVENRDYVVDYSSGGLIIKNGGDLNPGQEITVWYVPCHLYKVGNDYQVKAGRGEICILPGGDIAAGETIYLDYSPVYDNFNDEILNAAVLTANGLIEREVDPDRQFGADATLATAATYRALEVVCRTAAARELTWLQPADKNALVWIKLAESYAENAEKLLRAFRPPRTGPANPCHS